MEFLASPVWWGLVAAASFVFAIWFRWGARQKGGIVLQIGRLGYFALVALGFVIHDYTGGVALLIASGIVGQIFPIFLRSLWIQPVSEAPRRPLSAPRSVEPLGRRAILRDILQYGISRGKVKALLQQGSLVAYENPNDGRISLVRPEDLAAIQNPQSGHEEQN